MYTRIRKLLEQVLLEYDPKAELTHIGGGSNSYPSKAQKAAEKASKAEIRRSGKVSGKTLDKVERRALARGGKATKTSGPKGKLPR